MYSNIMFVIIIIVNINEAERNHLNNRCFKTLKYLQDIFCTDQQVDHSLVKDPQFFFFEPTIKTIFLSLIDVK